MEMQNAEKNSRMNLAAFFVALAMLMTMVVVVAPGAQAVNPPFVVIGHVVDSNGDPVDGAEVTALSGTTINNDTTDENGNYSISMTAVNDEETVYVVAVNGTEIGSISFVADRDDQGTDQNVTLGTGTDFFNVVFFAYDESGVGVANVTITVVDALGTETNYTTNETGIVSVPLMVGVFDYVATPNASSRLAGMLNQSGDFELLDGDLLVEIDLSALGIGEQNILGFSIGDTCLFLLILVIGAALVALIGFKGIGDNHGRGPSAGVIALVIVAVLFALVVLGGASFDLSISGILDYFGLDYGVFTVNSESVGMFALMCTVLVGSLVCAMGWLAEAGAGNKKGVFMSALLLCGVTLVAYILIPGLPNVAFYAFALGILMIVAFVLCIINKSWIPSPESCGYIAIGLGALLSVGATLAIYNAIGADSTLFEVSALMIVLPLPLSLVKGLKGDNKGSASIFAVPGKAHLLWAFGIGAIVAICFMAYGMVKIAVDPSWMVVSLGILDDYHAFTVGALLVASGACLIALMAGWKVWSKAWLVFGAVVFFALGGFLYLYWYQVLPALGLMMIGISPLTIGVAVAAAAAIGIALLVQNKGGKMNEKGSAGFMDIVIAALVFIVLPIAIIWADGYYEITEGSGNFMTWLLYVILIVIGYAMSYVLKLHGKN
jgi:hypothetical protein